MKALFNKDGDLLDEEDFNEQVHCGYSPVPVCTHSIQLIHQLIEDYILSKATSLGDSSLTLVNSVFKPGRFSPFTLFYTLKRMNGLNNRGLQNHIFDVDFDTIVEVNQLSKPKLDPAFKLLCQKFLIRQINDP